MIKIGKIVIGLALLLSLAMVLSYCSSKSSDSGTTTTTGTASAGAGASASSSAIQSATLGLSATAGSRSQAPSLRKTKNLSDAVNGMYSGLRAKRADALALKAKFAAAAAPYPITLACDNIGGTETLDIVTAGSTTTTTLSYNNCAFIGSTTQLVLNGSTEFVDSGLSMTFRFGNSTTPYSSKLTLLSNGSVLDETVMTLTFSMTADANSLVSCGTGTPQSSEYTKLTLVMDGNMHSQWIDEAFKAHDETSVATAFTMIVTSQLDFDTCDAIAGTIVESGQISNTNNLDATGSESMTISASNPLTLIWTKVTTYPPGDNYDLSGTVSMSTSCFTGSLTFVTPIDIFYPTDADCPTAGEVTVSGDVHGSVVYTSTGGVQVKDGNGAVIETYATCDDAQTCR